ncbi:uncharacterized protein [Emydura macquarii macquarii]|uniref:uncharacterized protein n=1 Tax=Emydura macquarii macquarii TaxID=1129001 RepID=UPI00352AAB0A
MLSTDTKQRLPEHGHSRTPGRRMIYGEMIYDLLAHLSLQLILELRFLCRGKKKREEKKKELFLLQSCSSTSLGRRRSRCLDLPGPNADGTTDTDATNRAEIRRRPQENGLRRTAWGLKIKSKVRARDTVPRCWSILGFLPAHAPGWTAPCAGASEIRTAALRQPVRLDHCSWRLAGWGRHYICSLVRFIIIIKPKWAHQHAGNCGWGTDGSCGSRKASSLPHRHYLISGKALGFSSLCQEQCGVGPASAGGSAAGIAEPMQTPRTDGARTRAAVPRGELQHAITLHGCSSHQTGANRAIRMPSTPPLRVEIPLRARPAGWQGGRGGGIGEAENPLEEREQRCRRSKRFRSLPGAAGTCRGCWHPADAAGGSSTTHTRSRSRSPVV